MALVDENFKKHKLNYFLQPLLAAGFVVIMLIALGGFDHVDLLGFIGTTTLGASAFLVFSTPHQPATSMRRIWGGYAVSLFVSSIFSFFLYLLMVWHVNNEAYYCVEICAILAMAITMFLMVLWGLEHPPAAGLALGLVVEPWTAFTVVVIVIVILLMILIKRLMISWLIDLI